MAPNPIPAPKGRRGVPAALLAVLLYFVEQDLLAEPSQTSGHLIGDPYTISSGTQWLLTAAVLFVSWLLFYAVIRGIRVPTE